MPNLRFRGLLISLLGVMALLAHSLSAAEERVERAAPAVSSSSFSTVAGTSSMEVLNDTNKLGTGDRLSYRVVEERQEPIALMVGDSGEIEFPLIGRVMAINKTCKQLARELRPMLEKEYFYRATVILGLDVVGAKSRGKVYLTGQLRTQGALDLTAEETLTVSKAVLRAGGFTDFANRKNVKLVRKQPDGKTKTTIVNVVEILEKGMLDKDPVLEPGDLIVVPEKLITL